MSEQPIGHEHDYDLDHDLEAANDTFLMSEGLELLSNFRAIRDPQVRMTIRELVSSLRRTQAEHTAHSNGGAPVDH